MRYTEKINETDYKLIKYNNIVRACARQKLGKLEDLEEQLGCPLEVVVKLLKNHIYYAEKPNHKGKLYEMNFPHISFIIKGGNAGGMEYKDNSFICGGDCYDFFNRKMKTFDGWDVHLKDYKKTWWLKEDKSE